MVLYVAIEQFTNKTIYNHLYLQLLLSGLLEHFTAFCMCVYMCVTFHLSQLSIIYIEARRHMFWCKKIGLHREKSFKC